MKKLALLLGAAIVISASCTTPKVMRYYRSIAETKTLSTKTEVSKYFEVNAFILDPTAGANKTITDLSDRGQGSLVEALNTKTKTPKELVSALAGSLKESQTAGGTKGTLLWKKRIVLNVLKVDKERANRLQQILFTMEIPVALQNNVEFVSWDKIATESQVIDLGKITSGSTTSTSFSPEITLAGTVQGKAPGAFSSSKTFTEEKSFASKFVGLNAALASKSKFQVVYQPLPNESNSVNIVVEVTLRSKLSKEVTVLDFTGLYDGTIANTDQSKVGITGTVLIRPDFGAGTPEVPIDLSYDFRYRTAENGRRTEPEYDDEVTYLDGSISEPTKFKLFDKEESEAVKTWEITDGVNILHLFKAGSAEQILFDNSASAYQLLNWIKQTGSLKVSDYELRSGPYNVITTANIPNLQVRITP
ncbi:hypothetical protein FHW88_005191 [Mucilaginibacter sp. SG538B]|uniref:hypothetical protein n=1 Tax=Mucilaginibacter sp. SG538B TaxID=2587021 RepID=UPI00159E87CC|nr:hypothetical protein [Mucilaginibacter sp. SG538B]NVM66873.1 hypothetical protein [Mucilaginibacter sp. SG538B]